MKKKVIEFLESLGFETVSSESSPRKIYLKDNFTVTVEERK
ncbi:MAG: hypothetical protein ACFFAE_18600 [Candidatus Hodarchaeota archaeon]|jgi:adenylate cyclase class IV